MNIQYCCSKPDQVKDEIKKSIEEFCDKFSPVEETLCIFEDLRTKALYCECHIYAENIISLGTIDSPLDSENQSEYRANRDVVEDNTAFLQMKEDAKQKRSFSNIVAEYITTFDEEHPLKIIGGQHRFIAISEAKEASAVEEGVTEISETEEKPKKTTRSRRPNRNTQKKPRTTKKTTKKEPANE